MKTQQINTIKYVIITILLGGFAMLINSCIGSRGDRECPIKYVDFEFRNICNYSLSEPCDIQEEFNKDSLIISVAMQIEFIDKKYERKGCWRTSPINSLNSLSIKTLYDYSETFPANSDVTSLFMVETWVSVNNGGHDVVFVPIEEHIPILTEYWYISRNGGDIFLPLCLQDTTGKGGKQKFEITITLSDGTVLTHQTNDLMLK